MKEAIAKLFEDFDQAADPVLDSILIASDSEATAAVADGLAIRLVSFMLGTTASPTEVAQIVSSLVTELSTLRRNMYDHKGVMNGKGDDSERH